MVQQSIENLAANKNHYKPTIIVIAHRLSTIFNADRIFVMKNGEIQEVGTHR
jgi:ABC-type multidrug transport system fused ATPase/permease subunit